MEAEFKRERREVVEEAKEGGGRTSRVVGMKREREEEESAGREKGKGESGLVVGEGLARRDEVEKMWKVGVEGLDGLSGVTGVLARLERAQKAIGVVEGAT